MRTPPGLRPGSCESGLWMGLLSPPAYHTVAALGANGFGTNELMFAIWAGVWNVKDITSIHSMLPPDVCSILGDPMRRVQKPMGDPQRRMSHPALRSR